MIPSVRNLDSTPSAPASAPDSLRHRIGDVLLLLCCVGMAFCVVKFLAVERHLEDISRRLAKQIESVEALKAVPVP